MRVTTLTVTVWVLLTAAFAHQAAAQEPPPPVQLGGGGRTINGRIESVQSSPGSRPAVTTTGGSSAPQPPRPVRERTDRQIVWTYPDGGELRYVFTEQPGMDYCRGSARSVTCYGPEPPPDPRGRRGPRRPPITPQQIVEMTIVNVQLPEPKPNIDPGYAVTGLRAYLETGNSTTHTFEPIATVLGPLSISASSSYTVDWGDGATTGPHSSSGGKYPDGTITHVYRDAETVDITVTQSWTATWSLAGQSGTISGLSSQGSIPNFVVREVQASRRR